MTEISDPALASLWGALLLIGLLLGYPALASALALLRAQRVFGKLYWHVLTAFDRHRHD